MSNKASATPASTVLQVHRSKIGVIVTVAANPRAVGEEGAGFSDGSSVSWRDWLVKAENDIRGWDEVGGLFSITVQPNAEERAAIWAIQNHEVSQ